MRKLRILLMPVILLTLLAASACGPAYTNLAKGLYGISVGFDKLEKFNEAEFKAGDIDKPTANRFNNDIIKAVTLKKRANELMGTINPDAPSPTDIDSVLSIVQDASDIAADAENAGELGIKSAQGKQTFGIIMTGLKGSITIAKAVRK